MDARFSLLLACAMLAACGGADVDRSDTSGLQQPMQNQWSAQSQQAAPGGQMAQVQQPSPDQQPGQDPQPPQGEPGAQDQQTASGEPMEPAPSTTADQQQPMFAPTPATVVRETELKPEPALDAETLAVLPAQSAVIIIDRRGGWFEVVHEETRGWVRLLHVSSQPPGSDGAIPAELERAARVATGREGEGNIASTTGTRGLTPEELRQAEADPEELRRMEAFGADAAQADAHAREHGLVRRDVPYPSAPQGPAQ